MNNKEISWSKERGRHLLQVSSVASRMVIQRLNLQDLGLNLKTLPLCTEEEAVNIEELLPRAKEGFALTLKTENISSSELIDLYQYTCPKTTSGIWKDIALRERQNTLPEFGHVLATLALLLKLKNVTYFDFNEVPSEVSYETGEIPSFWYQTHNTAGQIWTIMEEIENSITKTLYEDQPLKTSELIKVGHFFTAGKEISAIFDI